MSDKPAVEIKQVFPYLRVRNGAEAIVFYERAFGAKEKYRLSEPSGRVGHAELLFGETTVMMSDEYPEYGICAPKEDGLGASIHLHVSDVDALTKQAADAGAKVTMPPTDQFYGERSSKLVDPFGHEWHLGQEIEKLTPEEIQKRFSAMCSE